MLAAMAGNTRPKWVIWVDPDIDIRNHNDIDWALSFRVQPARDVIVVDNTPAGPSDPSVDLSKPRPERTSSCIGIDATRPFGGKFSEVADVPGWRECEVHELAGFSSRPAYSRGTVYGSECGGERVCHSWSHLVGHCYL